jgi:triosephosphate isomerase
LFLKTISQEVVFVVEGWYNKSIFMKNARSKKIMTKKLIVGNWKMNPVKGSEARTMFSRINRVAEKISHVETVICPPLIFLESLGEKVTSRNCVLGAQDAFWEHAGAHTGQVSPDMLFYTKARYVIIGHSEQRALGDTASIIQKKIKSVLQFPLIPILCIGELVRDDSHDYVAIVKQQLHEVLHGLTREEILRIVIAYEPVWAIGEQATVPCLPDDVRNIVHIIRQVIADMLSSVEDSQSVTILYGGSVNEENAESYTKEGEVQGLLIGRTSLDPQKFVTLLKKIDKLL